ncbi:hypothetical protein ACJIZ3_019954 [Penstemon smallii]|uniref:Uncharacterized protein n=1 Tax=Penstemon smallii TaxID=265156 RepID=A0ABD3T2K6_9LAMI
MSSKSLFSSTSEERWVLEMEKNFKDDIDFNKVPTCVFRVPKTLTEEKPEAYTPKHIGLGPYHHFAPDFYLKQKQKLAALFIRASYDDYLDLDIRTLAWIMCIDGLFLLQYLHYYPPDTFLEKVPWDKILTLFKKQGGPEEEQSPLVIEIKVPLVSQMAEIAKIKFTLTPGGIRDVRFDDNEEQKKFYLPVFTLKSASAEIILRNLLAFEAAALANQPGSSTLELAEYVDLMCGIIDTPKDVSILKNEKIIKSELSDEEIARIFNGISKSTKKGADKKSIIDEAVESVNKKYDGLYRVKVARFLKKYVPASFNFLITIAVLVLLILSASCSLFGCSRWFGKSTGK